MEFYREELKNQDLYKNALANAEYAIPIPQYSEGQSLTSIWAVRSLGIDPTTGGRVVP